jgi:[NiFe] hydrogenase assembly HybE family chaperone
MDAPAASLTAADAPGGVAQRSDPTARVEHVFGRIHATRMQGLPFLNPALRVEAVGFRRWDGRWLGVLITPWFMNLLLLPDADAAWRHVRHGDSIGYVLPAGVFEFIGAHEPALGDYQSCSLFSPVFEFADQDGARATALAALAALFSAQAQAGAEGPGTPAPAAEPAPVSKRDFLRGRWQGGSAPDHEPR